MPPLATKDDVRALLNLRRSEVEKYIERLSVEQINQVKVCGEWTTKDVLAHLTAWQEMNINWVNTARRFLPPQVPAPGFTWSREDVDRLNQQIYMAHRAERLENVLTSFRAVYARFMEQFESFSEAELFSPGLLPFLGKGRTLAGWYREYAQHDGWGRNHIYQTLIRKPRISKGGANEKT